MNEITVLSFGAVADLVGKPSFVVNGPVSVDELKQQLEADFPALKQLTYAVAVNKKLVTQSVKLTNGSTVALLPPFSGG